MSANTTETSNLNQSNVLLITNIFIGDDNKPVQNFTGMPMDNTCPFTELIFDPTNKILGIIGTIKKDSFHWITRYDENGLPKPNKNKSMLQAQPFQQQRILINSFHEYYIRDVKEIQTFLEMYAFNKDFNWKKFLK